MARSSTTTVRKTAVAKSAAVTRVPKSSFQAKAADLPLETLSLAEQVARLTTERRRMAARIKELEANVSRLQAKQAKIADRVAWALDSLRDMLSEQKK